MVRVSLTVGVGMSRGVPAEEVYDAIAEALASAGLSAADVAALATIDAKAEEDGVVRAAQRLGVALVTYPAAVLARIRVPNPSAVALSSVGAGSVAEAAALAGGGELVVPKRRSQPQNGGRPRVTCAVARQRPDGARAADSSHLAARPGVDGARGEKMTDTAVDATATRDPEPAPPRTIAPLSQEPLQSGQQGTPPPAPCPPPPPQGDGMASPPPQAPQVRSSYRPESLQLSADADVCDLRHHGDAELRDDGVGLTDLAVNVRSGTPPRWLRERVADSLGSLAAYPDGRRARAAIAARHGVPAERVLLTAGAAEAFVLLARALTVRHPVIVHPQFTEPEAALKDAGHKVERVLLREEDGFRLDPAAVPDSADLVVIGNPTNPTSVLHPAGHIARLARPGRVLVVDEAFMDAVPGERASLAERLDVPGLVVLRSLTKTWGLAGLRIGYVLAEPGTIAELAAAQPLWPVSTPALTAAEACMEQYALAEAAQAAHRIAADRAHLLAGLAEFEEVRAVQAAEGPFVLVRVRHGAEVREKLRSLGFAARRGDTFPGLGPDWMRLAVRDRATTNRFLQALDQALTMAGC
ncbi:Rv2231c family pyridoxal phosphate-dependent protein CobC [Streptomyces sp. MUM 178J]|uniref:Rv2231c family pyridoxal phosphate-dependent protein CobC n=1 Tax=Streptomyces sp. MUM 178J TaxID=2791991 RepID=UPI001F04E82C|nr:Rv2231c family pyridoxal phosphate-dependent protein CobC [Streptomyces sp. MUM 178J]WRQ78801.1 Rv2231c family pyridoxal phosphate-dependent protein CobC [Streptomyces sp. MUM 178J]